MTIAECLPAPAGTAVQGLTATCKRVFEPRTAQTKNGARTVLDLVLEDGSGSIRASLWEPQQDVAALRGAQVEITSAKTRQGTNKDGSARPELSIRGDHLQLAADASVQPGAVPSAASPAACTKIANIEPNSVMVTMDSTGATRIEVTIHDGDERRAAERALATLAFVKAQLKNEMVE